MDTFNRQLSPPKRRHRHRERAILAVATFAAILLPFSCSDGQAPASSEVANEPDGSEARVSFSVDQALLGEWVAMTGLGVRLRLPTGWSRAEIPKSAEAGEAFELEQFFTGPGPSYLLAGRVPALNEALQKGELERGESSGPGDPQGARSFRHGGIDFTHTVGGEEEALSHSFLFATPDGAAAMLRYIVPREDLEYRSRLIESSFGTVERAGDN